MIRKQGVSALALVMLLSGSLQALPTLPSLGDLKDAAVSVRDSEVVKTVATIGGVYVAYALAKDAYACAQAQRQACMAQRAQAAKAASAASAAKAASAASAASAVKAAAEGASAAE